MRLGRFRAGVIVVLLLGAELVWFAAFFYAAYRFV